MRMRWMSATWNRARPVVPPALTRSPISTLRAVTTPSNGALICSKRGQFLQPVHRRLLGRDIRLGDRERGRCEAAVRRSVSPCCLLGQP